MTEHYKTLKQFLEGLVSNGHLAEYVKYAEKAKMNENDDNNVGDEPIKKPANRLVTGVINSTTTRDEITKNVVRVHIKMA